MEPIERRKTIIRTKEERSPAGYKDKVVEKDGSIYFYDTNYTFDVGLKNMEIVDVNHNSDVMIYENAKNNKYLNLNHGSMTSVERCILDTDTILLSSKSKIIVKGNIRNFDYIWAIGKSTVKVECDIVEGQKIKATSNSKIIVDGQIKKVDNIESDSTSNIKR